MKSWLWTKNSQRPPGYGQFADYCILNRRQDHATQPSRPIPPKPTWLSHRQARWRMLGIRLVHPPLEIRGVARCLSLSLTLSHLLSLFLSLSISHTYMHACTHSRAYCSFLFPPYCPSHRRANVHVTPLPTKMKNKDHLPVGFFPAGQLFVHIIKVQL